MDLQPTLFTLRPRPDPEPGRRAAGKDRILARLMRGPALNTELSTIALRFGGRLHELRREGYAIATEPLGGGLVRYRME